MVIIYHLVKRSSAVLDLVTVVVGPKVVIISFTFLLLGDLLASMRKQFRFALAISPSAAFDLEGIELRSL